MLIDIEEKGIANFQLSPPFQVDMFSSMHDANNSRAFKIGWGRKYHRYPYIIKMACQDKTHSPRCSVSLCFWIPSSVPRLLSPVPCHLFSVSWLL